MSPLTMYGYLQTILFGLKCMSIEKSAEAILSYCARLQQDIERFAAEYDTLGRHLGNARSKYEEGSRRLDRFRNKLDQALEVADDPSESSLAHNEESDTAPSDPVHSEPSRLEIVVD